MTTLQVDGLTFTFPPQFEATKYDEWSFYRNQFNSICGGAKAIDIICSNNGGTLWLIEIKDYRRNKRTKVIDIADEISFKVRDTLAGLIAAKINSNLPAEKGMADRFLRASKVIIVFHLEQPRPTSKLFPQIIKVSDLTQKLKQKLKAIDAHPKVVDKDNLHGSMSWTVS